SRHADFRPHSGKLFAAGEGDWVDDGRRGQFGEAKPVDRSGGWRYNGVCRGVAQLGSAPVWGAGGRRFKSCRPDQSSIYCLSIPLSLRIRVMMLLIIAVEIL
ncbi:MAG: hypothetical protein RIQ52_324, partial [Pseudomonadota bacterium]